MGYTEDVEGAEKMSEINFDNPSLQRPINEGTQKIWRFKNNYGASVVRHSFSYGNLQGLWELAVVHFNGESLEDFDLCYDTKITSDVVGYLKPSEVLKILKRIEALKELKQ